MPRKTPHHPHGEAVRLQAFLAHSGVASRRHAEELIAGGRVFVNGVSVTAPLATACAAMSLLGKFRYCEAPLSVSAPLAIAAPPASAPFKPPALSLAFPPNE